VSPDPARWFLTAPERGNPHTTLDRRHADGRAWSQGNEVRALVHGSVYFRALLEEVRGLRAGDLLLFTDWRGDADEQLDVPGTEVGSVFAAAAARGVIVRGLVWRSHLDRFQFSSRANRRLSEQITAAGGQCLLDMRVRALGSHHQKLVVIRHAGRPELDVAFIGGIDLCHGRRDDAEHDGDAQGEPMAAVYGARPPWHDVQLAVRGPAVGDAETAFRERWDDPAPLSRQPVHVLGEWIYRQERVARPLPPQAPDPAPRGRHAVQLLRTYPPRRLGAYPFAPDGERSVARGYLKAARRARSLIYLEDQYLWSVDVARAFAEALVRAPELRLIVVIPGFPEHDGPVTEAPNLLGREPALRLLRAAGGDRVAIYSLENLAGTPVYVHAKVCVIDDEWACVGSDNANRRSWTCDTELSCAVLDGGAGADADVDADEGTWAQRLRLDLAREHLGLTEPEADASAGGLGQMRGEARGEALGDLLDPAAAFAAFAAAAANLDAWHASGRRGLRPPGRLRTYTQRPVGPITRLWAEPLYRILYDPDSRPRKLRRKRTF